MNLGKMKKIYVAMGVAILALFAVNIGYASTSVAFNGHTPHNGSFLAPSVNINTNNANTRVLEATITHRTQGFTTATVNMIPVRVNLTSGVFTDAPASNRVTFTSRNVSQTFIRRWPNLVSGSYRIRFTGGGNVVLLGGSVRATR